MHNKMILSLLSLFLLIILSSNFFILVDAKAETDDKITFDEAENLAFEACRRYFAMQCNGYNHDYREVDVNFYKGYFLFQYTNAYIYKSPFKDAWILNEYITIQEEGGEQWYKLTNLNDPFKKADDVNEWLEEVYAGKALESIYAEKNYIEKDGKVYIHAGGSGGWYDRNHRLLLCNDFVSNSNGKAVMNVVFGEYGGPAEDYADDKVPDLNTSYAKQRELLIPINATVEFTKTEDGWRVSGGSLLEMISDPSTIPNDWDNKPYVGDTPFTGDETAIILALLALSGLACVPAVNRRKI